MTCAACVILMESWQTDCLVCGAARMAAPETTEFEKGRKMTSSNQTEKVASNRCSNCNRYSFEPDKFCRWCGFQQNQGPSAAAERADWLTNRTTVLGHHEEAPRSLSGRPLDALTQSVAVKTGSLRLNRCGALVIAALIAIPMWLLIILLSPFDAYVSVKAAWSQMNIR